MREIYLEMRRRYEPETVKLVIVAKSPPHSGKFFYNPNGFKSEPLFAEIARAVGRPFTSKHEGLLNLQHCGWVLVDATYEPVNGPDRKGQQNQIIERDYPLLREDLLQLTPDHAAPIVLIKVNVGKLLEPKLKDDGFKVLNRGVTIPFPAYRHVIRFRQLFPFVLHTAGIGTGQVLTPEGKARGSIRAIGCRSKNLSSPA